jgi:hypothetical protein
MKVIKYNLVTLVNKGTEEEPDFVEVCTPVIKTWSEENEEYVKLDAHNGIYEIVEDENFVIPVTQESRITELETMINVLLGVLE